MSGEADGLPHSLSTRLAWPVLPGSAGRACALLAGKQIPKGEGSVRCVWGPPKLATWGTLLSGEA